MKLTVIAAIAAAFTAGLTASGGLAAAATASSGAAHPGGPVYIRIAGTGRCVTAVHQRPGASVLALPCRHAAGQRWIIGGGIVRLAGTRLRMDISRRSGFTVLTLPGSWRDDWRLDRHHHLRDLVLSRRIGRLVVLTLPGGYGRAVPPFVLYDQRLVHRDAFIGFQGVRVSPSSP